MSNEAFWSFCSSACGGWRAGKIVRSTGFGIIGDISSASPARWSPACCFPSIQIGTGLVSEIIYSAIGAVILLLVVRLVRGRM
jgi:uncharacterized membrane protein YeaQ/YmgE (transglycosylase-associated protein family)